MLVCKYVGRNGSAAMLATTRSVGVTPQVNLRKPNADVTRSPKQCNQWSYKKDLCPSKFEKKTCKENNN